MRLPQWAVSLILALVVIVGAIALNPYSVIWDAFPGNLERTPPPPVEHTYKDVGTLVDIRIAGSWKIWRVETTKGIFHLEYPTSGFKGATVQLRDDGYLFIEGASVGNKILE